MHLNDGIAISTDHILLVPYSPRHVPLYHTWMQDPAIQSATASEPLSLEEEYSMQRTWRTDGDKLTFIICKPLAKSSLSSSSSSGQEPDLSVVRAGIDDADSQMLGDVNLFITPCDDAEVDGDPDALVGEVELMIAEKGNQGRGYGRFAMLAFLHYVTRFEEEILREYRGWRASSVAGTEAGLDRVGVSATVETERGASSTIGGKGERIVGRTRFRYFRAKIAKDNTRSMALFHHAGFAARDPEPNYFGEIEFRMYGHFLGEEDEQFTREWWGGSWRISGWKELKYKVENG